MFEDQVIRINNKLTSWRKVRVRPEELLVLSPHCLQHQDCSANVKEDLNNCKRCGKCRCKDLLELQEKYGVQVAMASGGRQALRLAEDDGIKAVVAVACAAELRAGIVKTFPKPVFAICNQQPEGPCKNTSVCLEDVEATVRRLLGVDD